MLFEPERDDTFFSISCMSRSYDFSNSKGSVSSSSKASNKKKVSYVLLSRIFRLTGGPGGPWKPTGPPSPLTPLEPTRPFLPRSPAGPRFPLLPCFPGTPASPAWKTNKYKHARKQTSSLYTVYIFLNDISTERLERNTTWTQTIRWCVSVASFQTSFVNVIQLDFCCCCGQIQTHRC